MNSRFAPPRMTTGLGGDDIWQASVFTVDVGGFW